MEPIYLRKSMILMDGRRLLIRFTNPLCIDDYMIVGREKSRRLNLVRRLVIVVRNHHHHHHTQNLTTIITIIAIVIITLGIRKAIYV